MISTRWVGGLIAGSAVMLSLGLLTAGVAAGVMRMQRNEWKERAEVNALKIAELRDLDQALAEDAPIVFFYRGARVGYIDRYGSCHGRVPLPAIFRRARACGVKP